MNTDELRAQAKTCLERTASKDPHLRNIAVGWHSKNAHLVLADYVAVIDDHVKVLAKLEQLAQIVNKGNA